jgi:hypothetical protein
MNRLKNDDTLTKLGDIYHYLLVLKYCLDLKEGEKIYVEQFGDISKEGKDDSFQMEVKHHINESNLTDRDSEFWNTLKNWLENKDYISGFKELILLTTSTINQSSSFYDWETKNIEERLHALKKIGSVKKKKEETFRKLYDKIFNDFDEEEIKSIIGKVKICSGLYNVSLIKDELRNHSHFLNVKEENFEPYLNSLLGYIIRLPVDPPYSWEISHRDIKSVTVDLRDHFSENNRAIPMKYETMETSNTDKYMDRRFVKEIERIKYEEMIPEAINDVWRTNSTIIDYFTNNYVFYESLEAYKKNMQKKLNLLKKNYELDYSDKEEKTRLKESKKYYNRAMLMELEGFGIIKINSRFFQNGIIHEIVDNGLIYWYIDGEENE